VEVHIVTKDSIKKKITHRSLVKVERASLKNKKKQTSPSLSPPTSRRSELPPSNLGCGDEPLAAEPTLLAVGDLKGA
jgi:hypothetical protein